MISPRCGVMIRDVSPMVAMARGFSSSFTASALRQDVGIEPQVVEERRHVASMLTFEQVQKMEFYSKFTPTSVSLSHFLDHAADDKKGIENSFLFLRREIPVRLANIMMELEVFL